MHDTYCTSHTKVGTVATAVTIQYLHIVNEQLCMTPTVLIILEFYHEIRYLPLRCHAYCNRPDEMNPKDHPLDPVEY